MGHGVARFLLQGVVEMWRRSRSPRRAVQMPRRHTYIMRAYGGGSSETGGWGFIKYIALCPARASNSVETRAARGNASGARGLRARRASPTRVPRDTAAAQRRRQHSRKRLIGCLSACCLYVPYGCRTCSCCLGSGCLCATGALRDRAMYLLYLRGCGAIFNKIPFEL